ncbi:MAG: hypothetical protein Kow00129_03190 [Thermoleophilia bacterium]
MTCGRSQTLVMDTTALINFKDPAELDIVRRVTGLELATTRVVFRDELVKEQTRASAMAAVECSILELVDLRGEKELNLWQDFRRRFGTGEASALAYARFHGACLMTDDQRCFEEARALLGHDRCVRSGRVLVQAVAGGLLTRAAAEIIFARWLEETFRMPWESFETLWADVFPEAPCPPRE